MDYKLVSRVDTILVKGNFLRVSLYLSVLDDIDWSWDSLMLPTNKSTIAIVDSINPGNDNFLMLSTSGEVKIKDLKENRYLELHEVENLACSGKLYNEYLKEKSRYDIEANNWFCMEFYEDFKLIEDYVFEETPQNPEELEEILVQAYLDYFNKEV